MGKQPMRDHLRKFDEKAGDGFFLGYSHVAKSLSVFNIRRQEMEETYHVTFSEDDEAVTQSRTERIKKDDHLPYVPAFDPLSTNNITILDTNIVQNLNSPDESPELSVADNHLVEQEPDDRGQANESEPAETHINVFETQIDVSEQISQPEPSPLTISPSTNLSLETPVPLYT
ncbi:hypothetical protein Tco_0888046 [Tanacetum coccineum]